MTRLTSYCALLSLIATSLGILTVHRCKAQIDSNALVTLYCGKVGGYCQMTVHCLDGDQYASDGGYLGYNGSFRLVDRGKNWQTDTSTPSFTIDTLNNRIVNLSLLRFHNLSSGSQTIGYSAVSVDFDTLPYMRAGDSFVVPMNTYRCVYYAGGYRRYGIHNPCEGSCTDSGRTFDTVYMRIEPQTSFVASTPTASDFRVAVLPNEQRFSFARSNENRPFVILNVVGVCVYNAEIQTSETNRTVALEPGYYVARLGNETLKFIAVR